MWLCRETGCSKKRRELNTVEPEAQKFTDFSSSYKLGVEA